MVNASHFPLLRGITGSESPPTLIERQDQEFVQGLLDDLSTKGIEEVSRQALRSRSLRLYQPIHRVFSLVVLELCCNQYGEPRLDRSRIESAGMVLRRVRRSVKDRITASEYDGWMQAGTRFSGWIPFKNRKNKLLPTGKSSRQTIDIEEDLDTAFDPAELDPDPVRRPQHLRTGNPLLDALLRKSQGPQLGERVAPLFIAPPEVTEATGKTLLYGLAPVSSSQTSERQAKMTPFSEAELNQFLHPYLQAGSARRVPAANQVLTASAADAQQADFISYWDLLSGPDTQTLSAAARENALTDHLADFIQFLRQVVIEIDLFGESPQSQQLYQAVNAIRLPFWDEASWTMITRPAADFLRQAARVLLERQPSEQVEMPWNWPPISDDQAAAIRQAVNRALANQMEQVAPNIGRNDDSDAEYVLRAFVRVRREPHCPPLLVWSEYTPPFRVRPWYEPSPAPPPLVPLPELSPDFLRNLKPNVTFLVPPRLAGLLSNNPNAVLGGSFGLPRVQLALDMICGFNIPIITICALFALNIVLALLDVIFHWMPFVKICIPFPKRQG
jgi:hypothetical protein